MGDNMTYLFERLESKSKLPACSESFWTSIFCLYLLHLGEMKKKDQRLNIWQFSKSDSWYSQQPHRYLTVDGMTFDDIVSEPKGLWEAYRSNDNPLTIPPECGGFEPDIILRIPNERDDKYKYVLIENKITTNACLAGNQMTNYPLLIKYLSYNSIYCEFYILRSVGCSKKLDEQTIFFQNELNKNFGILLWEDIMLQMIDFKFNLPGINPTNWKQYSGGIYGIGT